MQRRELSIKYLFLCICVCCGASDAFVLNNGIRCSIHKTRQGLHSYDDKVQSIDVDQYLPLPDRRAFIASLTFGSGLINAGDVVYGKDLDLLSTLTSSSPKHDNLQSDRMKDTTPITITLPLEPSSGNTFCVRVIFTENDTATNESQRFGGRVSNTEDSLRVYRAIVDTGSPYLVLPSSSEYDNDNPRGILRWIKSASASAEMGSSFRLLSSSEYPPTEEIYGAVKGQINWKLGRYMFRDSRLQITSSSDMYNAGIGVLGVLDDALTNEATGGGRFKPYALLGLIRNSNPNADRSRFPEPRPSFLEQEYISSDDDGDKDTTISKQQYITSFSINSPSRELTLSTQSLIPASVSFMPLVDLRTVGDFVDHYAVVVKSISFDDVSVSSQSLQAFTGGIVRPIVAVFDTGLTGCLLIRSFSNVLQKYLASKSAASIDEITSVSLNIKEGHTHKQTIETSTCKIKSSVEDDSRFYVEPIDLDWFDDDIFSPYIIVLGQTFLSQGTLTIDIDDRIATFTT